MVNFNELLQNIRNQNSTITSVELSGLFLHENNIGSSGAKALAETLRQNSTITSVSLVGNNIGDEGAIALAETLRQNSTITDVDLRSNNIGDEGVTALAKALRQNSTIIDLDLSSNNIGDEGATALAKALNVDADMINEYQIHEHENSAMEENSAISELSHIFRNQINPKKINVRDRLPPELMVILQQYQEKRDYKYFTKIQQKTRYVNQQTQQKQIQQTQRQKKVKQTQRQKKVIKDISNSYNEYLSFNQTNRNKTFIPRKLLLQFIEHGEMFFKFKNENLKERVIKKLKRIIVFEYTNVIERVLNPYGKTNQNQQKLTVPSLKRISIDSLQNLPWQEIERLLFEYFKDTILHKIIQSNHKKIQQKSMSEIITELQQNQRKLGQKQNQLKQNQVKLKTKQLELKNKKKKTRNTDFKQKYYRTEKI